MSQPVETIAEGRFFGLDLGDWSIIAGVLTMMCLVAMLI